MILSRSSVGRLGEWVGGKMRGLGVTSKTSVDEMNSILAALSQRPGEDALSALAAFSLFGKMEQMSVNTSVNSLVDNDDNDNEARRCFRCWTALSKCICAQLDQVWNRRTLGRGPLYKDLSSTADGFQEQTIGDAGVVSGISGHSAGLRMCLYMHFKEFGRASNTGKVLMNAFPDASRLYVAGVPAHELALGQIMSQAPSLVLFPAQNAVKLSPQVLGELEERGREEGSLMAEGGVVNLIVLDGTWRQARTLLKRVGGIAGSSPVTTACLEPTSPSLLHPLRRQSQADRVSTLESVGLALGVLERHPVDIQAALRHSVKIIVDAVRDSSTGHDMYGTTVHSSKISPSSSSSSSSKTTPSIRTVQGGGRGSSSDGA